MLHWRLAYLEVLIESFDLVTIATRLTELVDRLISECNDFLITASFFQILFSLRDIANVKQVAEQLYSLVFTYF